MHCASLVAQYSHARYLAYIVQLYSYHFIANSTNYLNAAGFSDSFFSVPVISRIESIAGVGRVEGGGGGWGAEGRIKHPFGLKEQCCAFSK